MYYFPPLRNHYIFFAPLPAKSVENPAGLSNFDSSALPPLPLILVANEHVQSETSVELQLQDKGAAGNGMANNRLVVESGRREPRQALVAEESLSPAFRGFIEIWARKIESVEQRATKSRSPVGEFNLPTDAPSG
jgi:hypothetical protein